MEDIIYLIVIIAVSVVSAVVEGNKKKRKRQERSKPVQRPVDETYVGNIRVEEEVDPETEEKKQEASLTKEEVFEMLKDIVIAKKTAGQTQSAPVREKGHEELKTDLFADYKGMAESIENTSSSKHEKLKPAESPLHRQHNVYSDNPADLDFTDSENLKRAVIASEILNRKYQ